MKICVLDAATLGEDIDLKPLEVCGEVKVYSLTKPEEVEDRIREVDVILTNKVVLGEHNLKGAKSLKLIGLFATGYNNIDLEYAKIRNIGVANVAGYSTESVAQHTFAMLFYLIEHMKSYDEYVKSREYVKSKAFTFIAWPFHELAGKTFGIVGLGAIGKKVAQIASAFGTRVIYYSTSGNNNSGQDYERVDFETLLKESDILSIHAPLNEKTERLIDYNVMKKMKPSSILLNLGRGKIVVEEDLMRALNEEIIAAAALDVLESEPMDEDSPLFKVEDQSKLLITPHIGWSSVEARQVLVQEVVRNIQAYKQNKVRNRVV